MIFESKYNKFHSNKRIWKCRLQNIWHLFGPRWAQCRLLLRIEFWALIHIFIPLHLTPGVANLFKKHKNVFTFSTITQHWQGAGSSSPSSRRRQGLVYLAHSIPWLLLPWRHLSPGQQQPWYWQLFPNIPISALERLGAANSTTYSKLTIAYKPIKKYTHWKHLHAPYFVFISHFYHF